MFSGFSHCDVAWLVENVVLIAAGGSPALDVAPTAAFEFVRLNTSAIICSRRAPPALKCLLKRRSSCVRRAVYSVPGLIKGMMRVVLAPPDKGRPSVPL